jgi:hypothetical protein
MKLVPKGPGGPDKGVDPNLLSAFQTIGEQKENHAAQLVLICPRCRGNTWFVGREILTCAHCEKEEDRYDR